VTRDVRMRGFRSRADVEDVIRWLDARDLSPVVETVSLADAFGRVLAEGVTSEVNVPPFRRAAMDGWAVRGEETFGATVGDPLTLRLIGESMPGAPFPGDIAKGEAIRIMTGAEVPADCDAVLRAEDGEERDGILSIREPVAPGRHVAKPGEDVKVGDTLLPEGRQLRPQDLGLAASIGHGTLPVWRRPRVSILATGDELLAPGEKPDGVRIVDSNSPMLAALVKRDGGEVIEALRVADGEDNVRRALQEAQGDVVLISGGSSVGKEDHAPRLLGELGTVAFHGVAMRPAAPSGVGHIGDSHVFLLPGNPVSCLSAYDTFAARIIRRFHGLPSEAPYRTARAPLTDSITSVLGRLDYVRATYDGEGITPIMTTGASLLSSVVRADGFVWIPAGSEGYPEGAEVEIHLYA
jgi:molybdopterin molybdotransferase